MDANLEGQPDMLRIVSIMSVPRVGWNEHWGCHWAALSPFGLADNRIGYGCWWEHTLSNLIEEELERGTDWLLTLDFDSMFTVEHANNLIHTFGQNPHIDALAAMQPKRADGEVLMTTDGTAEHIEFNGEPIKATTAHFGFTLFRAEAFARMPKPWFLHEPDANGSYRTLGRIDPDMYFWRKWRDCGNNLYVDPNNCVGHLELKVSQLVPDETGHLRTQHFDVSEWRNTQNARIAAMNRGVAV